MQVTSLFRLLISIKMLGETVDLKENSLVNDSKRSEVVLNSSMLNIDNVDVEAVVKNDNAFKFKQYGGQGGLVLLSHSENFKEVNFEYTFENFKTDFIDGGCFSCKAYFDLDIDSNSDDEESFDQLIAEFESKKLLNTIMLKDVLASYSNMNLLCSSDNTNPMTYNSFLYIDDLIFKLLGAIRNNITTFFDKDYILKSNHYDENDIFVEFIVTFNEMPFLVKDNADQYPNLIKMVISWFKICFKYVKNLFRNNNAQQITLRDNKEPEKLCEKENLNYEKSIISKINRIEKEISQLEKNLDDLINHIKGKRENSKKNTILFSLIKICIPFVIMFGFEEFQVRVKPKKSL